MNSQIDSIRQPKPKVFIGLSGGVDSAVSAALLQKSGYDVVGVYIKVWQPDWISCSWKEERRDAMRVAAHLGIPFVTLDLVKEYKRGVIDYMLAEYATGRTPNPDVMCNREVKFGGFWKWAHAHGADFVATGHYAQMKETQMLAGVDQNKDQSYFLWTLNQNDLEHILFPIGHLEKSDVRKLAKKFGLPNADKKDSQGLCFIGKVDVKDFLKHYAEGRHGNKKQPGSTAGEVLNTSGEIIGYHPGALFFTLGERHGFTISKKTTNDSRHYVVAKDMKKNTIVVAQASDCIPVAHIAKLSPSRVQFPYAQKVYITQVNWISGTAPKIGTKLMIRTRYRQALIPAIIKKTNLAKKTAELTITGKEINDPVTPGQSLVIYIGARGKAQSAKVKAQSAECLGGGIIL
ncbi:MAG: tRNA 2-thiouridine(34) synthase MnmA [Candidatus Taylorbacteria bacterium]